VRAAVASGGKGHRQEKKGEKETRGPHVSIIRSERAIRHRSFEWEVERGNS
jgi:hypothetical protein